MSEEKELFEWVNVGVALPPKDMWVHTENGRNWFYQGQFYENTFEYRKIEVVEWLRPVAKPLIDIPEISSMLESLVNGYEQWEADIISNNAFWWPNMPKDTLSGKLYDDMLILQKKRNEAKELLKKVPLIDKGDIELFKDMWYKRNPFHENNADSGEDMFWGTAELVAREYVASLKPVVEDKDIELKNFIVINDMDNDFEIWTKWQYDTYVSKALSVGATPAVRVVTHFDEKDSLFDKTKEASLNKQGSSDVLNHAVKLIKQWHNMQSYLAKMPEDEIKQMWDIYYNQAPEMKIIREALPPPKTT